MLDWFLEGLGAFIFMWAALGSGKLTMWKRIETNEELILWYIKLLVSIVITAVTISIGYFWTLEGAWHYVVGYLLIFVYAISSARIVSSIMRIAFPESAAQYVVLFIYSGLGSIVVQQFFLCHNFDVLSMLWEFD